MLALATAFSTDPRASFWGSYERQQGLVTTSAYLALFLLTATSLRSRAQVERLWAAVVWGSVPVIVYGLIQAAGLDPLDWQTDAASRVLSTVGRANFLGSYLVLVIPMTVGRALMARRPCPYRLLLAGQLLTLALAQARGAWVGLGLAAVVGMLVWAAATRDRRRALATLALVVLLAGLLVLLNLRGGPFAPLARIPGLERMATLARTDAGSTAARLTIWRATLPLIADRPWLGYGPETMRTVFARVFPPQLVYYQGRHVSVDRTHNLWLDLGMTAGLAGIVAFGVVLLSFGRLARRALRTPPERWEKVAWVALAAAIAGHLGDLHFGFDLTASGTVFWLVLALAAAMGRENTPVALPSPTSSPFRRKERVRVPVSESIPYVPPTLAVLALIALLCLRPLQADVAYWRSQQATLALEKRLAAGMTAVRLAPLEPAYRLGLAQSFIQHREYTAAEIQLVAAAQLSPDDPRVCVARAELYAYWGEVEPDRYVQAEAAYRRALELAPNVATYHTALGLVLARQNRLQEGVAELERAVDLDATDDTAYRHLSDVYLALGRQDNAAWARREAIRWSEEWETRIDKPLMRTGETGRLQIGGKG